MGANPAIPPYDHRSGRKPLFFYRDIFVRITMVMIIDLHSFAENTAFSYFYTVVGCQRTIMVKEAIIAYPYRASAIYPPPLFLFIDIEKSFLNVTLLPIIKRFPYNTL